MPTTTSRFAVLIDALTAALLASPALAGSQTLRVFDGPAPVDQGWTDAIFIGFDGDWIGTFEAVAVDQVFAYFSGGVPNQSQNETLRVVCCVIAWSGDITPKPVRDRAVTLLGAVETVIRTDPSVGGTVDNAGVELGTVFQEPFGDGAGCRIVFTVKAQAVLR